MAVDLISSMNSENNQNARESDDSLDGEEEEGEEAPTNKLQDSIEQDKQDDVSDFIRRSTPTTQLEIAYCNDLERKSNQIKRLTREITKLKTFISKRKQTYKRKRKDEGAPTRALSAYNIFVQDRFSKLAKDNEDALKSSDADAHLKRVPPASLVASTGNEWKELPPEEKKLYEEKAAADRKRYETQMAAYQPPERQKNKKRNKTGYNMFFSAHVRSLKQSDAGVPSERGSVARIVGNAWKVLSAENKQYYEREADKQNSMEPGSIDDDDVPAHMVRNSVHRAPMGLDIDQHDDRVPHRDGVLPHHNNSIMHQMMHGQPMHHGHPPHVGPQLGIPGHGFPHNPGQHHIAHQVQGYHALQHQGPPFHPIAHNHRAQPQHYSQHHSSHYQAPNL